MIKIINKLKEEIKYSLKKLLKSLPLIFVLIFFDQITKWFIRENFVLYETRQITSFLAITYTTNTGVAFGLFSGNNTFFVISTIFILLFIIFSLKNLETDLGKHSIYFITLIIAGGIGNLLDRIFIGEVIDFIDFQINSKNVWPIFNLADSYVFVGGWILLINFLVQNFKLKFKV